MLGTEVCHICMFFPCQQLSSWCSIFRPFLEHPPFPPFIQFFALKSNFIISCWIYENSLPGGKLREIRKTDM